MAVPLKHFKKGTEKPVLPEDGVLRLYIMRFCPFSQRICLVLDAKNIPHHKIYIDLNEKPEWYTEFSPLGKVPSLQLPAENGKPALVESLVIADYLDEKYPQNKLHSNDPLQKAQDRILVERFSAVIGALYPVFVNETPPENAVSDIANGLNVFEQELRNRATPFYSGVKPGMADYMIWPWFERTAALQHLLPGKYEWDKSRYENLTKWINLMRENDAVKSSYVDGKTHADFLFTRRTGNPDFDLAF